MKKIESFKVDHRVLNKGVYVSRIDEDVITYDIRITKPNSELYIDPKAAHTIEHIGATLLRNGRYQKDILYFGPMGCMTGFYLLVRNLDLEEITLLVRDVFQNIALWNEEIPGAKPRECGNYQFMDLEKAKEICTKFLNSEWENTYTLIK